MLRGTYLMVSMSDTIWWGSLRGKIKWHLPPVAALKLNEPGDTLCKRRCGTEYPVPSLFFFILYIPIVGHNLEGTQGYDMQRKIWHWMSSAMSFFFFFFCILIFGHNIDCSLAEGTCHFTFYLWFISVDLSHSISHQWKGHWIHVSVNAEGMRLPVQHVNAFEGMFHLWSAWWNFFFDDSWSLFSFFWWWVHHESFKNVLIRLADIQYDLCRWNTNCQIRVELVPFWQVELEHPTPNLHLWFEKSMLLEGDGT